MGATHARKLAPSAGFLLGGTCDRVLTVYKSYHCRGPVMLSETVVAVLSALLHQSDAEWEVNILPFGSIFWKDEMPAMGDLFDRPEDMASFMRCSVCV